MILQIKLNSLNLVKEIDSSYSIVTSFIDWTKEELKIDRLAKKGNQWRYTMLYILNMTQTYSM